MASAVATCRTIIRSGFGSIYHGIAFIRGLPAGAAVLAVLAVIGLPACGPRDDDDPIAAVDVLVLFDDARHDDGALTVAVGLKEAIEAAGWHGAALDFAAAPATERVDRINRIDFRRLKGVVLLGGGIRTGMAVEAAMHRRGVPVVGWHVDVATDGRPTGVPAVNVATDPVAAGRRAAEAVVTQSGGEAGVVIFADPKSDRSARKVAAMMSELHDCIRCVVLAVEWMMPADAGALMPEKVGELLARHGAAWTHSLAVADAYYDALAQSLALAGVPPDRIVNVAAGDGSRAAYERILTGGYQWGTVPEPLLFQGWRLIDELHRLCAGQPALRPRSPMTLLTTETIRHNDLAAGAWDPPAPYREQYRRAWTEKRAGCLGRGA